MNEKKSQTEISKAKTKPEQMNIHKYVNKHTNKYIHIKKKELEKFSQSIA